MQFLLGGLHATLFLGQKKPHLFKVFPYDVNSPAPVAGNTINVDETST